MLERNLESSSFKIKALSFAQWFSDTLVDATAATNAYIVFAPEEILRSKTCEEGWAHLINPTPDKVLEVVFIKDYGIFVFTSSFAIFGILIPVMHLTADKLVACLSDPSDSKNTLFKASTLETLTALKKTISGSIALASVVQKLAIPTYLKYGFYSVLAAPTLRLCVRQFITSYPKKPIYAHLKALFPENPRTAKALGIFEGSMLGLSSAISVNTLIYWMIDILYDGSHSDDFPYTNILMLSNLGVISPLAAFAILNEKLYDYISWFISTVQITNPLSMFILSLILCIAPKLEDISLFNQETIYIAFADLMISVGFALWYTRTVTQDAVNQNQILEEVVEELPEDTPLNPETMNHSFTFFAPTTIQDANTTTLLDSGCKI